MKHAFCGRRASALLVPLIISGLMSVSAAAQPTADEPEELVVTGQRVYPTVDIVAPAGEQAVDTAELLGALPGANLNPNGTLSGIAQYRGLYGDRVAVSIDGLPTVSGGPNAMDAPLSYASPLLLDNLSLERGIASVSSATESLGGHIGADFDRGEYTESSDFSFAGSAQTRYETNGDLTSTAVRLVGANRKHKLALLAERDNADDLDYPGGRIVPTRLERDRYDLSYGVRGDKASALFYAGRLDTENTGTPALPMDIDYITTDLYGFRSHSELGNSSLEVALSRSEVDHVMDNFSLRTPPPSPMSYRANHATAEGSQWRIASRTQLAHGELRLGVDGDSATHTAIITNPNAAPFRVENFNDADRDVVGTFGQWNRLIGAIDFEAGLRVNRIDLSSGPVTASIPAMNPMMAMMAANAALLADAFNDGDLSQTRTNVDAVFKIGRALGEERNAYVEVARKTRAPSYQEAFLWLPLQSTGGLADGRNYIGNAALRSEVSREINLGTNWRTAKTWIAPQIFYKRIADYIQGVPSANPVANAISMMMSGMPALEFANTDAEIHGVDLAWGYYVTDSVTVDGVLSFVRGKRTDVVDNLYRLAPLNGRVGLSYERAAWGARLDVFAYGAQTRVAAFNAETPTSGFAIVNASLNWLPIQRVRLSASVENLLDRRYQPHLAGVNRVDGADIALGERLYGTGRSVGIGITASW